MRIYRGFTYKGLYDVFSTLTPREIHGLIQMPAALIRDVRDDSFYLYGRWPDFIDSTEGVKVSPKGLFELFSMKFPTGYSKENFEVVTGVDLSLCLNTTDDKIWVAPAANLEDAWPTQIDPKKVKPCLEEWCEIHDISNTRLFVSSDVPIFMGSKMYNRYWKND